MSRTFNVLFLVVALTLLASVTFAEDKWTDENNQSFRVLKLQETSQTPAETLSCWDFESGWDGWWADNGVWEVGHPDSVVVAHSGNNCGGTVLNNNYPDHVDSRLVSPGINLPNVGSDEALRLRFWHWFKLGGYYDKGQIQISVDSAGWRPWVTISGDYGGPGTCAGRSSVWSAAEVEISKYAGKRVRIGFYLWQDDFWQSIDWGWYVDDVCIIRSQAAISAPVCWDFEDGWGDWWVDNGAWEIGHPDSIPTPHSGALCGGTVLNGNYPDHMRSRLVSPAVELPTIDLNEDINLRFWHWFRLAGYGDKGQVQISIDSAGIWKPWVTISSDDYTGISSAWTPVAVDVSEYAARRIRIGFYLWQDDFWQGIEWGWYIDSTTFECPAPEITVLLSPPNNTTGPANDTFYWHSSFRATSYQIQIAYDSMFASLLYDSSNILDTTCYLIGLDTTIWWRVRGENVCGYGPWSNKGAYTDVEEPSDLQNSVPGDFALKQNYPNPFNPQTKIEYTLPKETQVKIAIYNLLGQRVRTLVNERQTAGHKEILWDGKDEKGNDVASGTYFYQLKTGEFSQTKKMVLIR